MSENMPPGVQLGAGQPVHTLQWLPIAKITVDHEYQREQIEQHLANMRNAFDGDLFYPIVVVERADGTYAAVDGGHRYAVASYLGWTSMQAMVLPSRSVAQEAALFRKANRSQRRTRPLDDWKAALAAKDRAALALDAVVQRYGYHIGKASGPNTIQCIGALSTCFKRDRTSVERALGTMRACWDGDVSARSNEVVQGLCHFFYLYPEVKDRHLHARLVRVRPGQIVGAVNSRGIGTGSGNRDVVGSQILYHIYNGKRTTNALPWRYTTRGTE